MELQRAGIDVVQLEALDGAVVERNMGDLPRPEVALEGRSRVGAADGEAMVLGGHKHLSGL